MYWTGDIAIPRTFGAMLAGREVLLFGPEIRLQRPRFSAFLQYFRTSTHVVWPFAVPSTQGHGHCSSYPQMPFLDSTPKSIKDVHWEFWKKYKVGKLYTDESAGENTTFRRLECQWDVLARKNRPAQSVMHVRFHQSVSRKKLIVPDPCKLTYSWCDGTEDRILKLFWESPKKYKTLTKIQTSSKSSCLHAVHVPRAEQQQLSQPDYSQTSLLTAVDFKEISPAVLLRRYPYQAYIWLPGDM
jgi:hypothetical protein